MTILVVPLQHPFAGTSRSRHRTVSKPQGSIELVSNDLDVIDPLEHHSLLPSATLVFTETR